MKKKLCSSGKSSSKRSCTNSFSTDGVLIDVYNALTRDFQRMKNIGILPRISTVKEHREIKLPTLCDALDVSTYKAIYQLKTFFNRYTASDDKYSQTDRMTMSTQKYEDNLLHINSVKTLSKAYLRPVVARARKIIREILGDLQMEEVFGASRFGRRASIGVPSRDSYLDNKMVPSMSLSQDVVELFESYLKTDTMMASYLRYRLQVDDKKRKGKQRKLSPEKFRPTQLRLSFVPKKFDKLRGVMPYPTGDTFLALGIGDIMVSRLRDIGLNLSRLQEKHRRLVMAMSLTRKSVTMDLSGASDCVTRWLVRLLLPARWYRLLKRFYFKRVTLPDGRVVHTETFAGMGCGFTFPLQTLIFYSLLKAVAELVPVTGEISVYGDDCIFPTPMFPYVERVFEDLGLKINRDKTFVTRFFRESCGEDSYRGTSVRPFQLEGQTVELSGSVGAAYLYKILNGLLHRWKHREIPSTVECLLRKIAFASGSVLLVPPFQPDTAGFKVLDPDEYIDWYIPVNRPCRFYPKGSKGVPKWLRRTPSWLEPLYVYTALRQRSPRRFVRNTYPYLWEHLRTLDLPGNEWHPYLDAVDNPTILGYAPQNEDGASTHVLPYVAAKGPGNFIVQAVASLWVMRKIVA